MGRRVHKPDTLHRRQEEAMAGYGIPEVDIACVMDIDPKTLPPALSRRVICSSVNRLAFMSIPFGGDGLYPFLDETVE
jgi:hypothetical protein